MMDDDDRPHVEAFRVFLEQAHSGEIDPEQMQADDEIGSWWDAEVARQRERLHVIRDDVPTTLAAITCVPPHRKRRR